ncbi:MAG: hypothetical protein U5L45_07960 [Saprospiraceae bacterium]|nr:hypothetical protein [Saprospiraceae bacterium]
MWFIFRLCRKMNPLFFVVVRAKGTYLNSYLSKSSIKKVSYLQE